MKWTSADLNSDRKKIFRRWFGDCFHILIHHERPRRPHGFGRAASRGGWKITFSIGGSEQNQTCYHWNCDGPPQFLSFRSYVRRRRRSCSIVSYGLPPDLTHQNLQSWTICDLWIRLARTILTTLCTDSKRNLTKMLPRPSSRFDSRICSTSSTSTDFRDIWKRRQIRSVTSRKNLPPSGDWWKPGRPESARRTCWCKISLEDSNSLRWRCILRNSA